jgi:hypothetical protein
MSEVTRFPLSWPLGWKRTPAREREAASFTETTTVTRREWNVAEQRSVDVASKGTKRVGLPTARERLTDQLGRLGAANGLVSTNLQLTSYGLPRAGMVEPADPGVAVYFELHGKDRVLACDRWSTVAGNIAAIAAHIDAIRRVDRYGVGTLDQAFAGYDALPAPGSDNRPPWRAVLGFPPDTPVTPEQVSLYYRSKAKEVATNEAALLQLNLARDAALQELGA